MLAFYYWVQCLGWHRVFISLYYKAKQIHLEQSLWPPKSYSCEPRYVNLSESSPALKCRIISCRGRREKGDAISCLGSPSSVPMDEGERMRYEQRGGEGILQIAFS